MTVVSSLKFKKMPYTPALMSGRSHKQARRRKVPEAVLTRMASRLEDLYAEYNRRDLVSPDPLQFLYSYDTVADREVVGLISAVLAYGRVAQILRSVQRVLDVLGPAPAAYVRERSATQMQRDLEGFKHRFTTADEMVSLLQKMRGMLKEHGSLNACFCAGLAESDETVAPALSRFSYALAGGYLTPAPADGSACKRMNLYLRWMTRCDAVDPGGWRGVRPAQLIIPLDVHMGRVARLWGMTRRNASDLKTALEVTAFFRKLSPTDPIKYDFVLTRFGIRDDMPDSMVDAPSRA